MFIFLQPLGLMAALRSEIAAHPSTALVVTALAAFAIFNGIVQAMELPTEKSGALYRFLYRSGHFISFNFQYALKAKFPQYVADVKPDVKP